MIVITYLVYKKNQKFSLSKIFKIKLKKKEQFFFKRFHFIFIIFIIFFFCLSIFLSRKKYNLRTYQFNLIKKIINVFRKVCEDRQ